MEPTSFFIGLYFLVSILHLASSKVDGYNGWKNSPNVQYHIQTDEGDERYFKYQTKSGQYRKEKRLPDGTVVGTYGWVDPNGYLRLRDYIADNQGYRILKSKMVYVGGNSIAGDSAPGSFHTKYSPLPSGTFQLPLEGSSHRFGGFASPTPNAYVPPSENSYLPPYFRQPYQNYPTTTSTPASTSYLPPPSSPVSYPSYYSSSTPLVEVSHHSAPKASTPSYSPSTSTPSVAIYHDPTPKPIAVYASTPKPVAINYMSSSSSPAYSSTPSTVYSSTPSSVEHTTPHAIPAIGVASTTPPPPPPPIAGKFAFIDRNNNFITETEKNKLFLQYESQNNDFYRPRTDYQTHSEFYRPRTDYQTHSEFYRPRAEYQNNYEEYDGISTVQNGFRYYLPRHYHEEQSSNDGQDRSGSFGYIDPFGIRRVIYYNTSPGKGFVHRKNNRYVGFNATPYDPRPSY